MAEKQYPPDNRLAMILFIFTLFFAPLAFGTTEYWSLVFLEILVAVTGLFFFLPFTGNRPVLYRTPGLLPLTLLLAWMFFQCIPLPPGLVQVISPAMYEVYSPLLAVDRTIHYIPLTVNLKATILETLRITSYALFYILTVQLLSSSRRLLKTVNLIAGLALFTAFIAIAQKMTAPHTLYWFRPLEGTKTAMGPWVYANHYAGFMVLLCPLVLALFFHYRPKTHYRESWREKVLSLFSMPASNIYLFLAFGLLLIVSSIALSYSRGGIFSMAFALILFISIHARHQSRAYKIKLFFLVNSLLFLTALVSWQSVIRKFNYTFGGADGAIREDRLLIWRDSWSIIKDFFISGSGSGTFIDIFPAYKTLHDLLLYEHTHNDFVELFTTGGVIGFILAAWFVLTVLITGFRMAARRRDEQTVLLATGTFSGLCGLLFFALTDFNLQNGANCLYFFFFCGLLTSSAFTRKHFQSSPSLLPPAPARFRLAGFMLAAVLLASLVYVHGNTILAARMYRQADTISSAMMRTEKKVARMIPLLEQAAGLDPLDGRNAFALANIERYSLPARERVLPHYIRAAAAQPMDGAYLQAVALSLPAADSARAEILLEQGYRRGDQEFSRFVQWMHFLLKAGKQTEADRIIMAELLQYPALLKQVIPVLLSYSYTQQQIADIIPHRTSSWISCSQLLKKSGKQEESIFFLEHALDYIEQEPMLKPHFFTLVYHHYRREKQEDKAIATVRLAIKWLPEQASFHLQLGDYYSKKGIYYRAEEEYKQAQLIDPDNRGLPARLEKLRKKQGE